MKRTGAGRRGFPAMAVSSPFMTLHYGRLSCPPSDREDIIRKHVDHLGLR
jgi:hypothetical protein